MANRVLLGEKNSLYGLYISRPGKNVLTCTEDELIFNMDDGAAGTIKGLFQLQPVTGTSASATTSVSAGATATVSITNLGWTNGIIPYALGAIGTGSSNASANMNFNIGSFSNTGISITNTTSSASSITVAASPRLFSGALF
jgi:hypothetical protein